MHIDEWLKKHKAHPVKAGADPIQGRAEQWMVNGLPILVLRREYSDTDWSVYILECHNYMDNPFEHLDKIIAPHAPFHGEKP
jgi:hypothetical protein